MALSGWDYNKRIRFRVTDIPSTQTDIPVLINICDETGINATDLSRFFIELEATGSLKVAAEVDGSGDETYVEVERYSYSEQSAQYHVLVPSLADGTFIDFYYDSEQDDNDSFVGVVGSTPGQAVWANDYAHVYHLSQTPDGTGAVKDSLALVNGTSVNMDSSDLVAAYISNGLEFNGSDEQVNFTFPSNLSTATVELSFKSTGTPTYLDGLFTPDSDIGNYAMALIVRSSADGVAIFRNNTGVSSSVAIADFSAWNHVSFSFSSTSEKLINHVSNATSSNSTSLSRYIHTDSRLSRWYENSRRFPGVMRGLYISSVVRSDDWLAVSYMSRTDNLLSVDINEAAISDYLEEAAATGTGTISGYAALSDICESIDATSTELRWGNVVASDQLEEISGTGTSTIMSWGSLVDRCDFINSVAYWSGIVCNDFADKLYCTGNTVSVGYGSLGDGLEAAAITGFCTSFGGIQATDKIELCRAKSKIVHASEPIRFDRFRRCNRLNITSYGTVAIADKLEVADIE